MFFFGRPKHKTAFFILAWIVSLHNFSTPGLAERFPIKTYGTPDGLSSSFIENIYQDSRGYLWICTRDGLSRFDGYKFTTYKASDGLTVPHVNAIQEDDDGTFWVVTNSSAIYKFDPAGKTPTSAQGKSTSLFTTYSLLGASNTIRADIIYKDSEGRIWLGTNEGLLLFDRGAEGGVFRQVPLYPNTLTAERQPAISAILEDRNGEMWIGLSANGLYRISKGGRAASYTSKQHREFAVTTALLEDRQGRLWVGTKAGLCLVETTPEKEKMVVRLYSKTDGLLGNAITALTETRDGHLWIGTLAGLTEYNGVSFRSYRAQNGLNETPINKLVEDRDGNLWIGTQSDGLMKLSRNGFIAYGATDNQSLTNIHNIFEDDAGNLFVVSGDWIINQIGNAGVKSFRLNIPDDAQTSWLTNALLQDHRGELWAATHGLGVFRFPKANNVIHLGQLKPKAHYSAKNSLMGDYARRIFEDSRGNIWFFRGRPGVVRWERATETFHVYAIADGLPSSPEFAFCESKDGQILLGVTGGKIYGFRDGQFASFSEPKEVQRYSITAMFFDSKDRLWIADNQIGVVRIDSPFSDQPTQIKYSTVEGLSSDNARCFAEDQWGRIYVGTVRGLDRIEPETGRITHFSSADGLNSDFTKFIYRDRQKNLWIGTLNGISKFTPEPPTETAPPEIVISSLRIGGEPQAINELGETQIDNLELEAGRNHVQIDFTVPAFGLCETLRFSYKLEGSNQEWSPLTELRTVNYANLSPGRYRFLVRAINAEGVTSLQPATASFRILPPIWQRWWFIAIAGVLASAAVYALFRYRVNQLVEIERVRTRIAADLHDDIGASLSHIAVVSEVSNRQLAERDAQLSKNLSVIARISRESVDSMSDIVWAINPHRDHLYDLTRRMRNFASELLPARDIAFDFKTPNEDRDIRLGADVRRQIFLIYKESLNNLVRHSGCTRAEIEMRLEGRRIVLRISDNGTGFEFEHGDRGNGLKNMRKRAESLGGRLEFTSNNGSGTTVILEMPHHPIHKAS